MESFFLTSEKDFWNKTEFFGELKKALLTTRSMKNRLIYIKSKNEKPRRYELFI